MDKRQHDRVIIAHHLIWTGYGHWLPNDPRGSGSGELRDEKFAPLGDIHFGRKRVQPGRDDLREFMNQAEPLLNFGQLWFDDTKRQTLGHIIGETVRRNRYTAWACGVLRNHMHMVIRRHRDDAATIWNTIAQATADRLRQCTDVPTEHPVWSRRPYKVFLKSPDDVRGRIAYVEQNPMKENLPPQSWEFVVPYDGWPHR